MEKPHEIVLYNNELGRLEQVRSFIINNLDKELSLTSLAKQFRTSKTSLRRHFVSQYHQPIHSYILSCRMEEALILICTHSLPLSQISEVVGYSNYSSFKQAFIKQFGRPPASFLRNLVFDCS